MEIGDLARITDFDPVGLIIGVITLALLIMSVGAGLAFGWYGLAENLLVGAVGAAAVGLILIGVNSVRK